MYISTTTMPVCWARNKTGYVFRYADAHYLDPAKKAISPTLPKTKQAHVSEKLFPFFFNLLPEGSNKRAICRMFKIDEDDYFSLLLTMAGSDTIGAVHWQIRTAA